jgi:hypothetical protein
MHATMMAGALWQGLQPLPLPLPLGNKRLKSIESFEAWSSVCNKSLMSEGLVIPLSNVRGLWLQLILMLLEKLAVARARTTDQ